MGAKPLGEGGADLIGGHEIVDPRTSRGPVESEGDLCGAEQAAGYAVFARFREPELPQEQGLGLLQLGGGDVFRLHGNQITLDEVGRLRDALRIAAVRDGVELAGFLCVQAHVHIVDVAGDQSQVVIEASGEEAAARNVVAELRGVVVGVEAGDAYSLR